MKKYSINNLKSIIYILTALLIVLILIITSKSNINVANTFCLWILGCAYFFFYLRFVFDKFLNGFLKLNNKVSIILVIFLSSILLCWLLPIRFQKVIDENIIDQGMRNSNLTIEALGEKNDKSSGYEVCLEGIKINNTEDYNLYNIKLNKDWNFINGRPTYLKKIKSDININLGNVETYQILMRKNENAGKIKIKIGTNEYVYDLYSKNEELRYNVDLSKVFLQNKEKDSVLHIGLFYFAYLIIIESIMFSIIIYLKSRVIDDFNT